MLFLRSLLRLLITANVLSSPILVTLIMETISSSLTSVLTRATRRRIPEDGILHLVACRREWSPLFALLSGQERGYTYRDCVSEWQYNDFTPYFHTDVRIIRGLTNFTASYLYCFSGRLRLSFSYIIRDLVAMDQLENQQHVRKVTILRC
jgi:hypothetical protein